MKIYDSDLSKDGELDPYEQHSDAKSGVSDWLIVVFVLVIIICVIFTALAIIFAIKNQLCGHCVRWADSTSDFTKTCSTFLKRRYHHLKPEGQYRTRTDNQHSDMTLASTLITHSTSQRTIEAVI